ncbi:MAG: hypothetical protein CV087_16920 [Candidatus Brocadia sp. WS118]|nr:MAG: hypothetical protein CV087_16920 [Candidatus Brocadia sp. WS118]
MIISGFFIPGITFWAFLKRKQRSWFILFFLIIIYGSTLYINKSNDSYAHLQHMDFSYRNMPFELFWEDLVSIFQLQGSSSGYKEPFIHILSYLLGSVFHLTGLYFVIVSAVYGYFFSKSVFLVLHHTNLFKKIWIFWGFTLVFLLIRNIEGLQAVRMWTGMWILFYATFRYVETKDWKYLLLTLGAPFMHLSFLAILPAVIPVLLFRVLNTRIMAIVFILSFIVNTGNISNTLKEKITTTTEFTNKWSKGYELEEKRGFQDRIEAQTQSKYENRWYKDYLGLGIQNYTLTLFICILVLFNIFPGIMSLIQRQLFSVGLSLLTLANLTWFNSALSGRSQEIGMLFVLAAFVLLLQTERFNIDYWRKMPLLRFACGSCVILWIPFIIAKLSTNLDNLSVYALMLPPVVWVESSVNYSVKELLRFIFRV